MSSTSGFPMNIIEELVTSYETFMPDHSIIERPLRYTDPAQSVGIFIVDQTPERQTLQIGQREPVVNTYSCCIQNMVKATDEVHGRKLFGLDAKTVRVILYRDTNLLVRLSALVEDFMGSRERFTQIGLSRTRFLNNELSRGQFVWLARSDIWIQTEVSQL